MIVYVLTAHEDEFETVVGVYKNELTALSDAEYFAHENHLKYLVKGYLLNKYMIMKDL